MHKWLVTAAMALALGCAGSANAADHSTRNGAIAGAVGGLVVAGPVGAVVGGVGGAVVGSHAHGHSKRRDSRGHHHRAVRSRHAAVAIRPK